ncbi:DEAD-box ATP-dependent RNA helicase 18 [Cryptosporidium felis]|nr:DEAD-box ATP-dependent RNA helicase 18 [Cryptosporidium felis]
MGKPRESREKTKGGGESGEHQTASYRGFEAIRPEISEASLDFVRNTLKFKFMSPVQEVTIPELLSHKDVAVEACTGSGKTLSYLLPVVEILLKSKVLSKGISDFNIGSLVLTPTRELSAQVSQILQQYLAVVNIHTEKGGLECPVLRALVCIGGDNVNKTLQYIRSYDATNDLPFPGSFAYFILIGTPGRVFHLFETLEDGTDWNIKSTLEVLILDEADRLLEMGFERHINMILRSLPKQRRTGLFSATLNSQVQNLIKTGLRNPRYIKVSIACDNIEQIESPSSKEIECDISVPMGLTCYYIELSPMNKAEFLLRFLDKVICEIRSGRQTKCIIFFLTCNSVEFYFGYLSKLFHIHNPAAGAPKNDYFVESSLGKLCKLHGQMYQRSREKSYEIFKSCQSGVLISTDLTARGIDIPDIEWIIQFDAPQDPSYYIHRIGRTARAGRLGKSIIMLQPHEGAFIDYIEKKTLKKVLNYAELEEGGCNKDFNSIQNPFYHRKMENVNFCSCIKTNEELMERDEFSNCEENKHRIGAILMRRMMLGDFRLYEKAKKGFVSYIRAYKEYQLGFIFPMKKLRIGEIASSFALLRIPRVKEILGKSKVSENFITASSLIHPDDLNPNKEPEKTGNLEGNSFSKSSESRQKTDPTIKPNNLRRSRSEKRAAKRKIEIDDWNSLQLEANLAKKLKTGKITYKGYQKRLRKFHRDSDADSNSSFDSESGSESSSDSSSETENESGHSQNSSREKEVQDEPKRRSLNKQRGSARPPKWVLQNKKKKKRKR